jgi:pantetheine-phosphate adenylyltransferase
MVRDTRLAIFPGSFDPLTNGHVDVIGRCARLFDRVVVAILHNPDKQALFSLDDRLQILREETAEHENVEVDTFEGLLVEYARRRHATAIVRGLRSVTDFDYEMHMALMNRHLDSQIETVFLMPSEQFTYVSSRLVKEIAGLGGSLRGLVPASVETRLARRREAALGRLV